MPRKQKGALDKLSVEDITSGNYERPYQNVMRGFSSTDDTVYMDQLAKDAQSARSRRNTNPFQQPSDFPKMPTTGVGTTSIGTGWRQQAKNPYGPPPGSVSGVGSSVRGGFRRF